MREMTNMNSMLSASPYSDSPKLLIPSTPKQWRHWCKKMGLRPTTSTKYPWHRATHCWLFLKGKGFMWRINCFGELERGDTYADFDRWALCHINRIDMPLTFDDFKYSVNKLVSEYDPTLVIIKQRPTFEEKIRLNSLFGSFCPSITYDEVQNTFSLLHSEKVIDETI